MKKLVLVLVFALFSITAINAEETENKSNNEETTETSINAPAYWQGWASSGGSFRLYLTVYQSDGMCNSYYAIASKFIKTRNIIDIEPVELVVKKSKNRDGYYVTYDGTDYSFIM